MKPEKLIRHGWQQLIFGAAVLLMTSAGFAETNSVRLAIGPFFAPPGNQPLEKAASELPDLLTASLSQQNRFQLVEREKVNAIWNEMHLAEAGLTSADTVGRLGRILSCDWLVSGSFVQTGSGAQIWVKVINTQDSVVLDLQAVPYNGTNFPATTDAIARFLAQTGSRSRPREFMALGKFEDRSISSTREDWSPRLVALIEKHFLAAGYGVVEREAMGPIFSEYQFQTAGLTGDSTNRVKLKPAFWIVDGGCKWIYDTQDKLSVTIRIRKVGSAEQELNFSQPPGDALEKAVVEAIQSALTNANPMTLEQMQQEEGKIRSAHVGELIKGRGETAPLHYSTNQTFITVTDAYGGKRQMQMDPAFLAQRESHAREMLKTLQQAILLNPKDMRSKWALGMSLYCMDDPADKQHGQELLEEVAASDDVTNATKAKNWLADFKSGRLTLERGQLGNLEITTHGQPASVPVVTNQQALASNMAARMAKLNEITNVFERSDSFVQIPSPPPTGRFRDISAVKVWQDKVLVASGTQLQSYDLLSEARTEVNLPIKLQHPIRAIEADDHDLWLGTEGGGLIRIPQSGSAPTIFGEKDGFPIPSISALRLKDGRLFIGFGSGPRGAFGYLDLTTGKFTGLMGTAAPQSWQEATKNPPAAAIASITTVDGTNFWVCSSLAMQHLDLNTKQWSLGVPKEFNTVRGISESTVTINSTYLAMCALGSRDCLAICRFPSQTWTAVNVPDDNVAFAAAADQDNPSLLWIGSMRGRVRLLDTAKSKVVGECKLPSRGMVQWILDSPDHVIFIAMSEISQIFDLYCLKKSDLARAGLTPALPSRDEQPGTAIKNVVSWSDRPLRILSNLGPIAYLSDGGITAYGLGRFLGKGPLLVACGTTLESYDWTGAGGLDFEKFDLPLKIKNTITAIACDQSNLWLGTDGGGLIQIPQSGAAPRIFNQADGFPFSSIRSLALVPNLKRLFIGFGQGKDGAFGYLDTATLKFTEPSSEPSPRSPVGQIKAADDTNTLWIASAQALYRRKIDSGQCSVSLPSSDVPDYQGSGRLRTLSVFSNFVATIIPSGGIALCDLSNNQWMRLNLSTNLNENYATTLAIDSFEPNHLWVGGYGKIRVLDMNTRKIIGEFYTSSDRHGAIDLIIMYSDDVLVLGDDVGNETYVLYQLTKPKP
jgi:hypothetical protein